MLDLGAWWSLETAVNESRYEDSWIERDGRPSDILRELNETVIQVWHSWNTSEMLTKLQNTLQANYWSVLTEQGRNDYERRSSLTLPTVEELSELLNRCQLDPMWSYKPEN